jgi:hypothetical protein
MSVIQNGLIRLKIEEATVYGFKIYYYDGSAWSSPFNRINFYLPTSAKDLFFPHIKTISVCTPEKIVETIRLEDTADQNGDYYVDVIVTIVRGSHYITLEVAEVYPLQTLRIIFYANPFLRWAFVGDAETYGVGDDDLDLNADNTALSDNLMVSFDDDGTTVLGVIATSQKPSGGNARFEGNDEGNLIVEDFTVADLETAKVFIGLVPFSLVASLFTEAEDETLGGGADTEDLADDSGTSARLNAQNESVSWSFTAGTDMPAGRYLALSRAKDTNQVADDYRWNVYNSTDSKYRNEENDEVLETLTASFAYYQLVFDVTDADVSGGDTIAITAYKNNADANTVYVDYFLIVPVGDGESFPQTLSHNALRTVNRNRRILER